MKLHEWLKSNDIRVIFELEKAGIYSIILGLYEKAPVWPDTCPNVNGYKLVEHKADTLAKLQGGMDALSHAIATTEFYKMGHDKAMVSSVLEGSDLVDILTPGTIRGAIETQLKEYPQFGLPSVEEALVQITTGYSGVAALLNLKPKTDDSIFGEPANVEANEINRRRAILWLEQVREKCPLEKRHSSTMDSDIELA